MIDTVSVFTLLQGAVLFLSLAAGLVWLRQRRMRGLYTAAQEGDMKAVERELARGVGAEELGIALMWACSSGQAPVVGRLLAESGSLVGQRFSLASCLMCACKRGHRDVVALLLREEAVLLDTTNKSGLTPEEVTGHPEIKELLREEHWRRAKLQVGEQIEQLEKQEKREVELLERRLERERRAIRERFTREAEAIIQEASA